MQIITIPNTTLNVSRIIFGTASLIKNYTTTRQLFILNKAIDCGITHFDTAPVYGFGSTESVVGLILKKNKNLTITTKVGLYPFFETNPNFIKLFSQRIMQTISRRIFVNPLDLTKPVVDLSVLRARKSLENSLKYLKRETIDIYLIHDPNSHICFSDEWQTFLNNLKKEGKIRFTGVAYSSKYQNLLINKNNIKLFDILQLQDSLFLKEADIIKKYNLQLQITYGYYSSIKNKLKNFDYVDHLKKVFARNKTGAIIISTNNVENMSKFFNITI